MAIFDIAAQNPAEIGLRMTSWTGDKQIECCHFGIEFKFWANLTTVRECCMLWVEELLSRVAEGQTRWSPATCLDSFGYTPRSLGKVPSPAAELAEDLGW